MTCARPCENCHGSGVLPDDEDGHLSEPDCHVCRGTGCASEISHEKHCTTCAREGGICRPHAGITYDGDALCLECARVIWDETTEGL